MTDNENVQNTTDENVETPKTEVPESEAALTSAQQITNEDDKLIALAESSKVENMLGKTEVVYIEEGKPTEYGLKLQYPGSTRALQIQTISAPNGDFDPVKLMDEAIKDVIVVPRIKSVDDFWNVHEGLSEAVQKVLQFLTK